MAGLSKKEQNELIRENKALRNEVATLSQQLLVEKGRNGLQHTRDFLKYVMDFLMETGMSKNEAFEFIIRGLKGILKI